VGQSLDLFAAVSRRARGRSLRYATGPRGRGAGSCPLWVRGEISGFKAWQSGHWYSRCATAAPRSAASCSEDNRRLPRRRKMGCRCSSCAPTLWEKGEFRLTVVYCLHRGGGAVAARLREDEGRLARTAARPRRANGPLPPLTAPHRRRHDPDGAALQDIIAVTHALAGRELLVLPTRVQEARSRRSAPLSRCCAGSRDWTSAIIGGAGTRGKLLDLQPRALGRAWPASGAGDFRGRATRPT